MVYHSSRRIIWTVVIILGSLSLAFGQVNLRVNEAAARIQIQPNGDTLSLVLRLPVQNFSTRPLPAHARVELVDPEDKVQSHAEQDITLPPSSTVLKFPFPAFKARKSGPDSDSEQLIWDRLRYSITLQPPGASKPVEGVVSVSEITPQLFELHIAGSRFVSVGGHFTLRVRALQPVTAKPVAGVSVDASLDVGDTKPLSTRPAVTDHEGFASLVLTLPGDMVTDNHEIEVKVTGTLGGYSVSASGDVYFSSYGFATVSTDKPLYQPGQTLHLRLLAFGRDKKALADQPVTITIADPEGTTQYAAHLRTSRFGIAAADWQIPENLRLGDYAIKASFDDERYESWHAFAHVKLSRYELPTFSVTAKPDHSYYLPGQNAKVEVRADYLFGKPVQRGHVRIVHEDSREWNYREQKWDIKEAASYEGDTDNEGRYIATLDLSHDYANLTDNEYSRFRDLSLTAYFTDSSTRRTEQRHFDIRITKDPIHVYFITNDRADVTGLPFSFIVSTDYADGSPAECNVEVDWVVDPYKGPLEPNAVLERHLRRVHTNRLGLAKVSELRVPSEPDYGDAYLSLSAIGRGGGTGQHKDKLWYSDDPALRVATDKVLYGPQDPIEVTLTSNQHGYTIFVEAIADGRVLASQTLAMDGGRASVVLPPNLKFQGRVTVSAYGFKNAVNNDELRSVLSGSRDVLFPKNYTLQLNAQPEKSTYRPGDEATVNLHVTGPEGQHIESALGLVVVDKALEERQRTDQEVGRARGFYGFLREDENCKGIRRSDLDKLDMSQPLPPGMDLVAEVLVGHSWSEPASYESDSGRTRLREAFASLIDPQVKILSETLERHYERTGLYPRNGASLAEFLASEGIQFTDLRDPWGRSYVAEFSVERADDLLTLKSSGPDKRLGTGDDFQVTRIGWPYFRPHAEAIQQALNSFHHRTGGFIHDLPALKDELRKAGTDLDSWKDHWGHSYSYTFSVAETRYIVLVASAGPDGIMGTEAHPSYDDFNLSTVGIEYTVEMQKQIETALALSLEQGQQFPQGIEDFRRALQPSGITPESFQDPWGHHYYVTFRKESVYDDSFKITAAPGTGQANPRRTQIVPITKETDLIYIRCAGEDGIEGTKDDFTAATFSRARLEQSSQYKAPVPVVQSPMLVGTRGAITGTVTDPSGAVVPGAEISAIDIATSQAYTAKSGSDGMFTLRNVPPGLYRVKVSVAGFKTRQVNSVPVRSLSITQLDVTLQLGVSTQTVMVSAAAPVLQTASASVSAVTVSGVASMPLRAAISTPKLRDYFPETLLWQPELVTDDKGRTQVKFPLAGSITTWTLKAVASTVNGEIGTAEKEIRAFQPFFIDHDPPRFLTAGDEIDLPVVLRNYLDHPLQASVEMAPQNWFTLANPAPQAVEIPSGDSANSVFRFTAVTPVKQGKQRVTARSHDAADAIEKTVAVHPNGQEKIQTLSQVFLEKVALDLQIPNTMLPGSLQAELKIYPNLNAHILESIDGIMRRPYGCTEQTISSTYPSLLYLRLAGDGKETNPGTSVRARHYVQLGYDRLLSYQAPGGGFTFWGRGEAKLALTVYALRFLTDASAYVLVDKSVIEKALSWLLNQAQPDGRWKDEDYWWEGRDSSRPSAQLTAYIARTIAASKLSTDGESKNTKLLAGKALEEVRHALDFVEPHVASVDEPYLIAAYALAALDSGQEARAAAALQRLRQLEHREGNTSYWSLEMNTPFYGWGYTGRLETTALVVEALEKGETAHGRAPMADDMVSRGLLFLLKNQDQYGVWYSSQATVNVLRAIAAATVRQNSRTVSGTEIPRVEKAEILVDGNPVASLDLPVGNKISSPVVQDLSRYLSAGTHHVEIRRPSGSSGASLQLLADYYVPWAHSNAASDLHHEAGGSDALRLAVHYDKDSTKPGESVTCKVDAERVGFRGYGMMLAEIGLPPGAEVDRTSLERAMTASGWDINQYDILPDRVVFYLWPRAGGVKFSFTFKFRYGVKALTAPSILYDYYNPEARAEVEPTRFLVQ